MTVLLPELKTPIADYAAPAAAERKLGVVWLVISAIAIGLGIQIYYGQYDPLAIKWLSVALLAAAMAVATKKAGSRRIVLALVAGGVAIQFARVFSYRPTIGVFTPREQMLCPACLAIAAACAVGLVWPRVRGWALAGLLAMHVAIGVLIIYSFPHPAIDVYRFAGDAATALVHGHDPYAVRFRDIYGRDSTVHYGVGTVVNGWLQYGYPYPPVPLLLGVPGLLAGDVRYAYLLAVTGAGVFVATMGGRNRRLRRGVALDGVAVGAAALLLFLPSQFLVIQCGFSEPAVVLLLAATVWTALRHPRWLAIPLGLLLVCKQYMIFAVPAAWLLVPAVEPGKRRRVALETIAVGAAVSLPFAAIAGERFWRSVVVWQFHQPFRKDALSYPALLANAFPYWSASHHIDQLAPIAGFLAGTVALAICLKKLPRTPAGFAACVGLTLVAFFAFNKQAFCNYYYFVIAAFCTAIAAAEIPKAIE